VGQLRQSAETVFADALELKPEQRQRFVDQACRGDPVCKRLVEELLREQERADTFLRPLVSSGQNSAGVQTVSSPDHSPSADSAPRFSAGEVIAQRFLVVRFIARGGMGEVYEVEDRLLHGNRVALKIIRPEIAAHEESSHRFVQEVLLARKISHPNLCPIYEIFRCDDVPPAFLFLTMKLLHGETLDYTLRTDVLLSHEDALDVFQQMIAGIGAIHAAGIVHRDIKPTNVMLERSGSRLLVSVMDFGLARNYESEATLLSAGAIAGTPGYLAPELLHGHPPSRASDLFALGVLLHQVLTGERPIDSADGLSVEAAPALATASVPKIYKQTVSALLSTDPLVRCRALEHYLEWIRTKSTETSSTPLWTRRRMLAASGAACCALAGGVYWKRDSIADYLYPLPAKRFVALLGWPPSADETIRPFLLNLLDSIASELARAEAYDQNLFLIPHLSSDVSTLDQLNDVRESLGANLVLGASGARSSKDLHLSLQVLPASSAKPLRARQIKVSENEELSLVNKAVRAVAELLDIRNYEPNDKRTSAGTSNLQAYAAFQEAEALRNQSNDVGLEAAIEKYKAAIVLDGRYALAIAHLALAYCHLADVKHDPAAIVLARANAETALAIDPALVPARMALAGAAEQTGDETSALREMKRALAADPANTMTLTWLGQAYTRQNRWQSAENSFRRALQLRPNNWIAHNELGMLFYEQGKYLSALSEFRTAALASPRDVLTQSNVGFMYLVLGRVPEALEKLKLSLSLKRTALASAMMSAAFRSKRDALSALPFAREATNLDPGNSIMWLELGDCESMLHGHGEQAKRAYAEAARVQQRALEINNRDGPGWILLGLCEAKTGISWDARAHLRKGESLPSDDIDTQLCKARIFETLGQREDALTTLGSCLRRGATTIRVDLMPEMDRLTTDPRYHEILRALPNPRIT
jgi:eukaryotic-like serine/threonine-protein kinase